MRYEKYKDSGIEWIGEIPEHWETSKIKNYCKSIFSGGTPSRDKPEYWGGDIDWIPSGACKDKEIWVSEEKITKIGLEKSSTKLVSKDTPIIAMTGGTLGMTGYLKIAACTNQSITAFVPDITISNSRYLWYVLQSAKSQFLSLKTGGAQGGINVEDCKNIVIPAIGLKEQENIASFLDEKIAKIDSIIKSLEKQKDKLEEYKRALISETVTKGLDKNVSMKDSGVDWLGEIPEHWEVFPLFYLLEENKDKNNGMKNSNLLSLSYGNIIRKDIDTPFGLLPSSFEGYQIVNNGDIILRLTDLQNDKRSLRTGFVKEKGIITSAYVGLKQSPIKSNSEYIHYVLHAYDLKKLFYSMGGGLRQSLNFSDIKRIPLLFPPLKEQSKIVEELNRKQLKINSIRKQIKLQIEKLKEYRKIIIHDAVTGKLKVGGGEN